MRHSENQTLNIIVTKINLSFMNNAGFKMELKRWIRPSEVKSFFRIPVWLMGLSHMWKQGFRPLCDRVLTLWKHNGSTWLVQYLAEQSRAIVCWLGNEKYVRSSIFISITGKGLPRLIPLNLRKLMIVGKLHGSYEGKLVIRAVLTVLSIYRVMGAKPIVKLDTITAPFKGSSPILPLYEIDEALHWLGIKSLRLQRPNIFHISESSGPNYAKATYGSPLDAIAYIRYPFIWYNWVKYCVINGYYIVALWHFGLMLLGMALLPLLMMEESFPKYLGRLVKLNEARGKVRIIAIADWWTQIVFKPIHDSIMGILKRIPMDGTFNQVKPLQRLLDLNRAQHVLYSFDLSAATDRLPVKLQVQILTTLGVRGDIWKAILDRPWHLDDSPIRYSVGQPMGCYSSWAMLALTHHLIVQIAAKRSGCQSIFTNYAVLGDDIVIADEAVAKAYLAIMKVLGVDVNLVKSHQGSTAEFAKRWIHSSLGDFTPLGAGNILVTVRNHKYLPSLLLEMRDKGYNLQLSSVKSIMEVFTFGRRKISDRLRFLFMLMVLGPSGLSTNSIQSSDESLESWLRLLVPWYFSNLREIVMGSFMIRVIEDRSRAYTKWQQNKEYFENNCFRYSVLESKNSLATFGLGKGGGLLSLINEIINWEGATRMVRYRLLCRYLASALLIRVSPAWYAYMMVEDPLLKMQRDTAFLYDDELWDNALQSLTVLRKLLLLCMDLPESSSFISGWEARVREPDFTQTIESILKSVDRQLSMWNRPSPCQLVDLHIVTFDSTEVDDSYIRLIDGWETHV
jgi:hypothetical protein